MIAARAVQSDKAAPCLQPRPKGAALVRGENVSAHTIPDHGLEPGELRRIEDRGIFRRVDGPAARPDKLLDRRIGRNDLRIVPEAVGFRKDKDRGRLHRRQLGQFVVIGPTDAENDTAEVRRSEPDQEHDEKSHDDREDRSRAPFEYAFHAG